MATKEITFDDVLGFFYVGNKPSDAEFATVIGHDVYLVLVNVAPEDQAAFGGQDRIGVSIAVNEEGKAGVPNLYKVGTSPDGHINYNLGLVEDPAYNSETGDSEGYSKPIEAWLLANEPKLFALVSELNDSIPEDYYDIWVDHL